MHTPLISRHHSNWGFASSAGAAQASIKTEAASGFVSLHRDYPVHSLQDLRVAVRNLYAVGAATGRVVILPVFPCSLPWVKADTESHARRWTALTQDQEEVSLCEWRPDCPDMPVRLESAFTRAGHPVSLSQLVHVSRALLNDYGDVAEGEDAGEQGLGRHGGGPGGGKKRRRRRRRMRQGEGGHAGHGGHGGQGEGAVREGRVRRRRRRNPESLKLNVDDLYRKRRVLMAADEGGHQKQMLLMRSPTLDLTSQEIQMLDLCQDLKP